MPIACEFNYAWGNWHIILCLLFFLTHILLQQWMQHISTKKQKKKKKKSQTNHVDLTGISWLSPEQKMVKGLNWTLVKYLSII